MSSWRPLLRAVAAIGGDPAALEWHKATSWASITFSGERHTLCFLFAGAAVAQGEQLLAELETHEFDLPGMLVADAQVREVFANADPAWLRVVIELWTVED